MTFADAAGLVGKLDGGSVLNSYYAGSLSGMPGGYGLVAWYQSGTVTNNLFTAGDQACGYKVDSSFGSKISVDDLKTQASVDKLNTDAPATGFTWSAQGGLPVLISGGAAVVVNKDALKAAIDDANAKIENDYTAESWSKLAEALVSAQDVYANDDAKQAEVNAATKTLTDAIAALEKPKPTEPVAQPQNVAHLSSQSDLENKFKPADADAYYVLDNDITIDDEYFCSHGHTCGHTRRPGPHHHLANGGGVKSLMGGVASTGVVQNISFAGKLKQATDGKAFGPWATVCRAPCSTAPRA
ncbi:MAG: FIVAR domain-containing protein [Collinsella sp.]